MLVVFCGNSRKLVKEAVDEYLKSNFTEGAGLTTVESDNYQIGQLLCMLNSTSLFGGEQWFILDGPQENKYFFADVESNLENMTNSSSVFILIEEELTVAVKNKYKRFAKIFKEFKANHKKNNRFNIFFLTESLTKKDKRKLWLDYQLAKKSGVSTEEIIGILWWQLKLLRLSQVTAGAEEAGVKPYPYQKSKKSLSNFRVGELDKYIITLIEVYHKGRSENNTDLLLEKWILEL